MLLARNSWTWISISFVLVFWEYCSRNNVFPPLLFPAPSRILQVLIELFISGSILLDIVQSSWRVLCGYTLGSLAGCVIGIITGNFAWSDKVLSPLMQSLRPLPPVALIPLFILWFGIDTSAKIIMIACAVVFPVWINTHIGCSRNDTQWEECGRLLCHSKLERVFRINIPAAAPFILTGMRSGTALACVMVFVSELTGSSNGIGYRISLAQLSYRTDEMVAILVILGIGGALLDKGLQCISRFLFPWIKYL